MLDTLFTSVLSAESTAASMSVSSFLLCSGASLLLGVCIAFIYMFKQKHNKSFVVTLALLPLIVQMVISLVNGNIGAGIAVMGVFSLVRFRSIPGTAKDIAAVFMAMAVGLATGMGFIGLAALFTAIVAVANAIFVSSPLGGTPKGDETKSLRITIPEDMDYCTIFNDLLERYCKKFSLAHSKTTNMGSLYQVEFEVILRDPLQEKAMLDEIRTRNGNLTVQCGRPILVKEKL